MRYRREVINNQFWLCVKITSAWFSDLEQELSDYNGDDENEGEFEADKQAQLAQN